MGRARQSMVVGLFVLVGLVLIGGLILLFSKGWNFAATYGVEMKTTNVGLLIPTAQVRMAGVPVGYVERIKLSPDGRSVTIFLEIYQHYSIHRDARFAIEQVGFLGDQFISITPRENKGLLLRDGDVIEGEQPLNFEEIARSAVGLIQRVDQTVKQLSEVVARVDHQLFSERTLTNLTTTVENLRKVSDRTYSAIERIDLVVATNTPALGALMTNLVLFTEQLNTVADDVSNVVATNRNDIQQTIGDLRSAAAGVNGLVNEMESGRGLVGLLLKDEKAKVQTGELINNLTTLSSNLNRFGLLYRPRQPRSTPANPPLYPGRRPF